MREALVDSLSALPHPATVFIVSLLPILECRGGVLSGFLLDQAYHTMPWALTFAASVIGNIVGVIPVLLLIEPVSKWADNYAWGRRFFGWLFRRVRRRKDLIDRHGFWGLTVFVGIPLPVTGAWTGAVAALVFGISFPRALLALTLGVLISTTVCTLATYGGVGALQALL